MAALADWPDDAVVVLPHSGPAMRPTGRDLAGKWGCSSWLIRCHRSFARRRPHLATRHYAWPRQLHYLELRRPPRRSADDLCQQCERAIVSIARRRCFLGTIAARIR